MFIAYIKQIYHTHNLYATYTNILKMINKNMTMNVNCGYLKVKYSLIFSFALLKFIVYNNKSVLFM